MCIGLALARHAAVLTGSKSDRLFEGPGEMAVVIEAGVVRDLGQCFVGGQNLSTSEFKPQSPDIITNCAMQMLAEPARQMYRMYANCLRDRFIRNLVGEPGM